LKGCCGGGELLRNHRCVPADKSTVKTLLALGGNLQVAQAPRSREAEQELTESEWPEAFAEMEAELAPFA